MTGKPTKKAEQSEATRGALVAAARALFTERGFADAGTHAIVERAGVTRGALYHQFRDKTDLFRAVYESIEQELSERMLGVLGDAESPTDAMLRGVEAFLDACLDPAVQRIVLLEAPTVLGWEQWREIDETYGLGLIKAALQSAMAAGELEEQPVDALAHVLLGGLIEAGMFLAHAEDPAAAREEAGRVAKALVNGLRAPNPGN